MTEAGGDADPADAVRERLLSEHGPLIDAVDAVADAVADRWDDHDYGGVPRTGDRDAVVPALRAALAAADVLDHLPAMLVTGANALGVDLPASPVAAPPYLVVTATGPVVRATLPDRGRLVISVRVFEVDRGGDAPAYRRVDAGAREALAVEVR
ncbi:hypothetical protein [Halobaculum rarum]|uniref:hypothetical protein n=1 Tax=Halobaculum rarum TaxID=3075122 RepID=UPI0032AEBD68